MTQVTYEMFCSTVEFVEEMVLQLKGAGNFTFMKILVVELFETNSR